jgi:DNA-binding MarR family transcriptional regulator
VGNGSRSETSPVPLTHLRTVPILRSFDEAKARELVALGDRPGGRARLFELAEVLGWEKSRVSHQVARMSGRGLVEKERCDDDRRGAFVVATEQGRKAIETAAPHHVAAVRRLFLDRISPGELDAIASAAEKVLAVLDAESVESR